MDSYKKLRRYFNKKENRFKLASLLVLLLTLPAAVLLVQQTIRFFSGAALTNATVYILPSSVSMSGAQTFQVMIDPKGNPVGFASLDVTFDTSKVQLTADPASSGVLGTTIDLTTANNANTTGIINVDMGLNPNQTAPTQPFELIHFTMQPNSGVGSNVQTLLGLANIQIVDKNTEQDMGVTANGSTLTLNPVTATATPTAGTVSMGFGNIPVTIYQNNNFSFNVTMNTNGFEVVGTDLVVSFDPSKMNVLSSNSTVFNKVVNESINNQTGVYKVSLLQDVGTLPYNGSGSILTLNMKAVGAGSSQVSITPETVVAGTGDAGQNLTVSSTPSTINVQAPTPTPSPSPTAAPGQPDLVVTDISWTPSTPVTGSLVTFKATIKNQGTGSTQNGVIHGVRFSVDGVLGPWSDTHTTSLAPGASVTVTANGGPSGSTWTATLGNHTLTAWVDDQNRIAESNETNNTYNEPISISNTATATPNPTATPVPSPVSYRNEDIDQDGDVDIQDYTLLFTYYGQVNPTLARTDINRDGRVNVKDYALFYQAFQ